MDRWMDGWMDGILMMKLSYDGTRFLTENRTFSCRILAVFHIFYRLLGIVRIARRRPNCYSNRRGEIL